MTMVNEKLPDKSYVVWNLQYILVLSTQNIFINLNLDYFSNLQRKYHQHENFKNYQL